MDINQVLQEVAGAQLVQMRNEGKKVAVFALRDNVGDDGNCVMCFAVEGEDGYHSTNVSLGCSDERAMLKCMALNKTVFGLNKAEALEIIVGTMPESMQKTIKNPVLCDTPIPSLN